MIGQENLKRLVKQQIEDNTFPRFSIFVGDKGSGKRTFINDVIHPLKSDSILYILEDVKVETIRNMIAQAYRSFNTIFVIPNADDMSQAAKNALLKIVEEPCNNHYFIMTLEDTENTLATIRSRGSIYKMDKYSEDEIKQYITEVMFQEFGITDKPEQENKVIDLIVDLAVTPGEAQQFWHSNVFEFYKYVKQVIDNINEVSTTNALKIPIKIITKDGEDGYDLKLFLRMFSKICVDRAIKAATLDSEKEAIKYCLWAKKTNKFIRELKIKGSNKSMLINNWILTIREI